MVSRVFISYRRSDSQTMTERIYERLATAFGREKIFKDIGSIPAGYDFRQYIHQQLQDCRVMLVIMGPEWGTIADEQTGVRRLDDPYDFVRLEVETALQRQNLPVIPVLIPDSKTQLPQESLLPPTLAGLRYRNSLYVRNEPDFDSDVARLIVELSHYIGQPRQPRQGRRMWPWALMGAGVVAVALVIAGVALAALLNQNNKNTNPVTNPTAAQVVQAETPLGITPQVQSTVPPLIDQPEQDISGQTGSTQHYQSAQSAFGSLSFEYPASWQIQDGMTASSSICLASDSATLQQVAGSTAPSVSSGSAGMCMAAANMNFWTSQLGYFPDASQALGYFGLLWTAADYDPYAQFGAPSAVIYNGVSGLAVSVISTRYNGILMVLPSNNAHVIIQAFSAPGELTNRVSDFDLVASSIIYTP